MKSSKKKKTLETTAQLGSSDLAELIVDAMVDAGIVRGRDLRRAVEIATEEIDIRKALGDY